MSESVKTVFASGAARGLQHRRLSDMVEIWRMQPRFNSRNMTSILKLVNHPRFRAAYDFLMLRTQNGEVKPALAEWWTSFYDADKKSRVEMARTRAKELTAQFKAQRAEKIANGEITGESRSSSKSRSRRRRRRIDSASSPTQATESALDAHAEDKVEKKDLNPVDPADPVDKPTSQLQETSSLPTENQTTGMDARLGNEPSSKTIKVNKDNVKSKKPRKKTSPATTAKASSPSEEVPPTLRTKKSPRRTSALLSPSRGK